MPERLQIGVDFDNTVAGYDHVFVAAAQEAGLVGSGCEESKQGVREAIRNGPGGERQWQWLQGQVYGRLMHRAELIEGAAEFLERCRERRIPVYVVSHKTQYGHYDDGRTNLRDAAMRWMTEQRFFQREGFALPPENVFFETTREDKIARIAGLGCTHFVDDLEEVFREPAFPSGVARCLLARNQRSRREERFTAYASWAEITHDILG